MNKVVINVPDGKKVYAIVENTFNLPEGAIYHYSKVCFVIASNEEEAKKSAIRELCGQFGMGIETAEVVAMHKQDLISSYGSGWKVVEAEMSGVSYASQLQEPLQKA